ncbi:expansin-A25-like [Cucurbita moschata]|uniref:Expansin n=1 Tax=Cucurbita moschata TaxID=3662 RepID=A0A6J1ERA3_CUCMO|nr:expansin-A25-like [Cucurbita moschata]
MANSFNFVFLWLSFAAFLADPIACRLLDPIGIQNINGAWRNGRATFYGDMTGGETMQGACGYGNLYDQGYGLETAAISTALFNNGLTCGACFELKCLPGGHYSCLPNSGTIKITATNFCPPNYAKTEGVWCNPPQEHFDLSLYMFSKIAPYRAGVINVSYRRVLCQKKGGLRFQLNGNPYWLIVLPFNVGGAGDVVGVKIKGSSTGWLKMSKNWGQNWEIGTVLVGQSLSFQVTTSDWNTIQFDNVVPSSWQFGQTFEGKHNF